MGHILGINPMVWSQVEQAGLVTALDLPTLWPRFLHLVLAALAGTGIILTLHGTLRAQNPAEENVSDTQSWVSHDVWLTRYGAAWTLTGTLPQIVIGPWLLVSLPPEVRAHLLSGGNSASILFFVSLTLALLALVLLNASMMVPQIRWLAWTGMASLVGTIFLMIIVREEVRQAWLAIL
jgi:hypothetical protein